MTRRFDDLRSTRPPDRSAVDWLLLIIAAVVLIGMGGVVLIATSAVQPAHAGWTGTVSDPAIAAWYKNQHNAEGQWCCDESDGHPYFGDYKINDDGSVTIHDEGKRYDLPSKMVLKGANPTGAAVWWFTQNYHGERTSYCFAPGTLS